MNKKEKLQRLADLSENIFSRQAMVLQQLVAAERDLRHTLQELDTREREADNAFENDAQLRITNMDIYWKAWLGRQKASANMDLANVLAQKEREKIALRIAFGRKEAMATLKEKG